MNPYQQYLVRCIGCQSTTSKKFARANNGLCRSCITGQPRVEREVRGYRCPTCGEARLTAYQKQHHYHCDSCTREADPEGYRREVMGLNDSYGD